MALPPGPNLPPPVQLARWIYAPLSMLEECAARYGDAFTLRMPGIQPLAVFAHPDAIREVFTGDPDVMHAGKANEVLRPFLGDYSVLMLDGPAHLRQRKLLLPPFHGERMQAYGRTMVAAAHDEIDAWPVGERFAVHPRLQEITLQVILRTVFGLVEGARLARLSDVMRKALAIAADPFLLLKPMQQDLGRFSKWGRFMKLSREADAILFDEMRAWREHPDPSRVDVLSMLLQTRDEHGQSMSDQELRDELVTLLVAGHETTATALAWTLRFVLADEDLYTRLRDEARGALDESGNVVPERAARLELLDATVREALRRQPVIPMVGRVLQRAQTIGGYDLPAGVNAVPCIYLAAMRPQAFPDPRRFEPERFLRHKPTGYEWFPFGGGARRCIGMAFALYEMKMVLAAVLTRATLRLARPGAEVRPVRRSVTFTPAHGLPLVLTARKLRPATARAA